MTYLGPLGEWARHEILFMEHTFHSSSNVVENSLPFVESSSIKSFIVDHCRKAVSFDMQGFTQLHRLQRASVCHAWYRLKPKAFGLKIEVLF